MGMGIFMHNQYQPVFRFNSAHIDQDGEGLSLKIAECINSKGLRQRSRKYLDGGLLPRMKTIVASLEVDIQLRVYGFNMRADPGADGRSLL